MMKSGTVSRLLLRPLGRIGMAAAPIVVVSAVLHALMDGRHLAGSVAGDSLMLIATALILASYVVFVRVIEKRAVSELGGGWGNASKEVGSGLLLGTALFSVTMGILIALGVGAVERGEPLRVLASAAVAALAAGVAEEVLLRAIFFRITEEVLGTWYALALSAALFGALHAFNPGATVVGCIAVAVEAGVLLAAAFAMTRRLWLPMATHAAWNFTEGGIFGASVSGTVPHGILTSRLAGPSILTGGQFGPEASLVAVVVCLIVGTVFLRITWSRGRIVAPAWRTRA